MLYPLSFPPAASHQGGYQERMLYSFSLSAASHQGSQQERLLYPLPPLAAASHQGSQQERILYPLPLLLRATLLLGRGCPPTNFISYSCSHRISFPCIRPIRWTVSLFTPWSNTVILH